MIEHNPLRQYFRRPAIYLTLPSKGVYYDDSVLERTPTGELPVYPMTAIDEITTKTPDALFNGQAMVDIIKSCVPNIKDPWQLSSIDMDAILIAIKTSSYGSNMDFESNCPKCNEESKYTVNLSEILSNLGKGDYDTELILGDLKIKVKPLTYKELNDVSMFQFEMQKKMIELEASEGVEAKKTKSKEVLVMLGEITMKTLTYMIDYIKTDTTIVDNKEYIHEFLKNIDKNLYESIRNYITKIKESTGIKPLNLKCTHCEHEYQQTLTLNLTDFFG